MVGLLWGRVYYHDSFVGYLREEPGDRYSFTYDESYQAANLPPIAHTLPLRSAPFISQSRLHPFFDNLVAEGWLENAQMRLLGKREASRFKILLAFGQDCIGAVSIVNSDPEALTSSLMDENDEKELAVMTSRASLSGVQPKLALLKDKGKFRPAKIGEISTYIGKFPSKNHDDLVVNEYLTTLAYKSLVPDDDGVSLEVGEIEGISEQALLIKRFDRTLEGGKVHFEEFNQLLGRLSENKYEGGYQEMADFILNTPGCLPTEVYRLYKRIIAGFLLGNTDMHLKNFAMFHTPNGFRLTPTYDQVSAIIYNYKTVALSVLGAKDMPLGNLKPQHIIKLGEGFKLSKAAIKMAYDQLTGNIEKAQETIYEADLGTLILKDKLIEMVKKRWNGTFSLIGKALSTKL